MNLENASDLEAGYTMGVEPDGRELLVVVAKGTFLLPDGDQPMRLADEQVPLIMTDEFTGEPGFSAPLYEIDFAPTKPRCDVLLNGTAFAPSGKPTDRVKVSLRVGEWKKSFDVVGNRTWTRSMTGVAPSQAEPFLAMPISYNNAFGGVDKAKSDAEQDSYFLENHVGVGYGRNDSPKRMEGNPLPNTEETSNSIKLPHGNYRPMAFGPVGRAWKQRVQYAGTYDQAWLDNQFPFLPHDFRHEYYQSAPADQWIEHPTRGLEVELTNLTPSGSLMFKLPAIRVPAKFLRKNGEEIDIEPTVDTIVFEPDLGRFTMSARYTLPLKKNIHEMRLVVLGHKPRSWYEEEGLLPRRSPGKRRFESLDAAIKGGG